MKMNYITIVPWSIDVGSNTDFKNIIKKIAQKNYSVTDHTSFYNIDFEGPLKKDDVFNGVEIRRYKLFPINIFLLRIQNQIVHLLFYEDNFFIKSILHKSNLLVNFPIGG